MDSVEFCGESLPLSGTTPFRVGREGDLALDDNPYLHRNFLTLDRRHGLWWLTNIGSRVSATVSDPDGRLQAWVAPGAAIPLVMKRTMVRFTAGPTTYEFEIVLEEPQFTPVVSPIPAADGTMTIGNVQFTPDQLLMIIALAEPSLRREGWGQIVLPTSEEAAKRLGWPLTRFNRKIDNVCDKLAKLGVKGLHGGPDKLAGGRRARLVEYALAARWVTAEHLALLDR
jgi:hypothetical protein